MTTNPTPEEESIESATLGWVAWCERRGMAGLSAHLIRMRAALAHPTPAVAVAQPSAETVPVLNIRHCDHCKFDVMSCGWQCQPEACLAPPTGAGEPTTAWLIELADHTSAHRWWCGQSPYSDDSGVTSWTVDANKAIRFSRKQDAELAMTAFGLFHPNHIVTEHSWV